MTRFARFCQGCADLMTGRKIDLSTGLVAGLVLGGALSVTGWAVTGSAVVAQSTETTQGNDEREGGIIGTGVTGYDLVRSEVAGQGTDLRVGVYGTITALGSIYVNGHHIALDKELTVRGSPVVEQAADLRTGHTVAVVVGRVDPPAVHAARDSAAVHWQALDIRHVMPLVGPVQAIDVEGITVMGTRVALPEGGEAPKVGTWVAVSGLWQSGALGDKVIASRLDVLPAGVDRRARISGSFEGLKPDGSLWIGGTQITGIMPQHLSEGMRLRITGTPVEGGLQASQIEAGLFGAEVGVQHVEGYYSAPAADGRYTVLGSGLIAYTERPQMIVTSQRVLRCGQGQSLIGAGLLPEALGDGFQGC
ncbi:hypothetical protein [Thalassobius sp. Cn5-15]|uniref:hypothetical protein n=1 Tax=Thalassobius sp. Cn5-15 TaxID=2917763 RepID=UPI001EF3B383|nr:hypothetical protein [Thalassobius sp. Cn5-15]MCG7495217.1 hypothetical protein [Thalassobius sp. Cn5-15]